MIRNYQVTRAGYSAAAFLLAHCRLEIQRRGNLSSRANIFRVPLKDLKEDFLIGFYRVAETGCIDKAHLDVVDVARLHVARFCAWGIGLGVSSRTIGSCELIDEASFPNANGRLGRVRGIGMRRVAEFSWVVDIIGGFASSSGS